MKQLHRGIKFLGKLVSILLGCIILPLSIIALLDPVGTKMADRNDPFGDPGGPLYPIFLILISVVLIFWPLALRIYKQKQSFRSKSKQKSDGN
jgi:membrane protease YdiL (CAAX protease family)